MKLSRATIRGKSDTNGMEATEWPPRSQGERVSPVPGGRRLARRKADWGAAPGVSGGKGAGCHTMSKVSQASSEPLAQPLGGSLRLPLASLPHEWKIKHQKHDPATGHGETGVPWDPRLEKENMGCSVEESPRNVRWEARGYDQRNNRTYGRKHWQIMGLIGGNATLLPNWGEQIKHEAVNGWTSKSD